MIVKLLTEHHLEFLSFKGGCRCSSESTHIKMLHCTKSLAKAKITVQKYFFVEALKMIQFRESSSRKQQNSSPPAFLCFLFLTLSGFFA